MNNDSRPLNGKTAVVTGAGRGIGRAIATGFARAGADVSIISRTESDLKIVEDIVRSCGVKCHVGVADLADPNSVQKVCADAVEAIGKIDILVNNAGAELELRPVAESDPDLWWKTVEVNIRGVYLVTRFLLEDINDGGKIINMSSGMGLRAIHRQSAYTVSKAGLHIFTECLANELWPRNIDVNNIIPGPVATDMLNRKPGTRCTPEEVLQKFAEELPSGFPPQERVKHPDEVAELALHIATRPVGGPTGQSFSLGRRPF